MTMLSRVLGLVRDMVIARYFGAGAGADAFFVAFKIPNFLRRLFAEGAFAQAFVPVLSSYRQQESVTEVRRLVNAVAGVLGLVLLGVTAVAMLGAPLLTAVFAPGFLDDDLKFGLASAFRSPGQRYAAYYLPVFVTGLLDGVCRQYSQ